MSEQKVARSRQQVASGKQQSDIKEFTDLTTWQEAHKLALEVYRITQAFPEEEKFGLTSQMRRAAVSITSNIAEGFGRQNSKEKIQFYAMAQASDSEVKNQLILNCDLDYIDEDTAASCLDQSTSVHKLLTALIRSIR